MLATALLIPLAGGLFSQVPLPTSEDNLRAPPGEKRVTLVIDVSGSMDEPNKLPLVKSALTMLVNTTAAPRATNEMRGGQPNAASTIVKNMKPSWHAVLSLLIAAGSPSTGAINS